MNQHARRRVVVVGNLTIDDVVLPDGRTGIGSLGGGAIYAALGARLWSVPVGLVTRRGEDFATSHLGHLADIGIDTSGVVDIAGPTVRNWVLYGEDGSRTWVYRTPVGRSVEVAVQPADVPRGWLAESPTPVVHIAPMPLPAAQALVARVRKTARFTLVTMDTHEDWVRDYREELVELARRVDVFVPSQGELTDLVGYDDPERAAQQLIGAGVPIVVVKLGDEGAYVATAAGVSEHVEAYAVQTLDTTGAGDSFCGGLAAGLAAGEPITSAVQRGCVSASFAVESFGSMSLATLDPDAAVARLTGSASSDASSPKTQSVTSERYDIAVMMDEIAGIPDVVHEHFGDPLGAVQAVVDLLVDRGIEHLYLTGCGDSAFAAAGECARVRQTRRRRRRGSTCIDAGPLSCAISAAPVSGLRDLLFRQDWTPGRGLSAGRAVRASHRWPHQRPLKRAWPLCTTPVAYRRSNPGLLTWDEHVPWHAHNADRPGLALGRVLGVAIPRRLGQSPRGCPSSRRRLSKPTPRPPSPRSSCCALGRGLPSSARVPTKRPHISGPRSSSRDRKSWVFRPMSKSGRMRSTSCPTSALQ